MLNVSGTILITTSISLCLLKRGIVFVEPETTVVLKAITLQDNTDSQTRAYGKAGIGELTNE